MPAIFPFSEARIKALQPPTDKDREYHKDKGFPGLQVCVTSTGTKTYYLVKRTDGRPTRHLLGPVAELSVKQARDAAAAKAGKIAAGENPAATRRQRREEPTLSKLHAHWMLYANAHKKPRTPPRISGTSKSSANHWQAAGWGQSRRPTLPSFTPRSAPRADTTPPTGFSPC